MIGSKAPSNDASRAFGEPAANSGDEGAAPRVLLHTPVDVRSVAQAVVAVLACIFALQWAKVVIVPVLFGVMTSYALTPIVDRLRRAGVPRGGGAAGVLLLIAATIGWGAWALSAEVNALADTLPHIAAKVRDLGLGTSGASSTLGKVQKATAEIQAVADAGPPAASAPASDTSAAPTRSRNIASPSAVAARPGPPSAASAPGGQDLRVVVVDKHAVDVRAYVLSGTMAAVAFFGQVAIVFFVALFLLASGNTYRRKMVKLAGPRFSQKKVTIETLDEITEQIQRYLLVQVAVSILVGLATWLAFYVVGMQQSAVWGVVAGVTNLIPYVGAVLVGGGSAVVGAMQFGTIGMGLLVGGISFGIHSVIGNLLTPWWMGRASRMNPLAVFISVLFFGWLWGVAGLLLGVPILLVVKAISDRIEDLTPIGELLGA